ncbi:polyribonucleotide nucleotidyltransferase [bacterium]|nr:polyribonucleotide nucleotidyltransferase [bacterium]
MSLFKEIEVGGRKLKVVVGKTTRQADGAVWVQYGDAVMHMAVVSEKERKEGLDFLPLTVDYRERDYAGGKIPGGFFKREGRPQEKEILSARIIDRPIRPLFPEGYAYETQVMALVLSADQENDADILGVTAASIALNISDIPFKDVIASVRIGLVDGKFIVNPTYTDLDKTRLDLVMAGSQNEIAMVEGHAEELSNKELIDALAFGHEEIRKIVAFEREIIAEFSKPTREFTPVVMDKDLEKRVIELAKTEVVEIARIVEKSERKNRITDLVAKVMKEVSEDDPEKEKDVKAVVKDLMKYEVRQNILNDNVRLDGRCSTDIRSIECELGLLPRVHGSSLFTRGQTQALGTVTLGTRLDEKRIDSIDLSGFQKYMLHYNFPPYSTGEVKNRFGVTRREVGHGKLAERALEPVLPDWDDFPYTLRIVSEILESNGSSSMATVCAGSLALMDAGVPVRKPVAGIAMGLIMEGDRHRILTDILGDEDHLGDMDFKVAGTRDGITAFQMDIKIEGISAELMAEALTQAEDARLQILDIMDKTIDHPSATLSSYAPKFIVLKIPVDRIGALIGPGGKMIREIVSETGATIDVEDDGTVRIGAADQASGDAAKKRVQELTAVPEVDKVYEGTIKRIMDFGAFVEIIPGIEGLMHISQIEHRRIDRVSDLFEVGDTVKVKLLKVEPDGKLDLSRKALLPDDRSEEEKERDAARQNRPRRDNGFRPRGGGRGPRR